jgi:preprotein translocase subunit SecA
VKVEQRNFDIRKNMLEYDDVMNQQRKSIYALRRQVLSGQYTTEPTKDELARGVQPQSLVATTDPELAQLSEPIVVELVKLFSADPPGANFTQEQRIAWREAALREPLEGRKQLWYEQLEQQIYVTFGCQTELRQYAENPVGALEQLRQLVPHSLSEQRERLLDLIDEIVATMVQHACPKGKHHEDWDLEGLSKAFDEQFAVPATGLEKLGDASDIEHKLYQDAAAILDKREHEIGRLLFLRVFRNFYLQEIDNQWLEHLQNMDALRDGIGLRGYGQRDPKKEYQKEGFEYFLELMQTIKSSIVNKMFRFEIEREEEVERLEEHRRAQAEEQQERLQLQHAEAAAASELDGVDGDGDMAGGDSQSPGAGSGRPSQVAQTVRRTRPKVGRNDPCWCGSGKKYKTCHMRSDAGTSAS